MIWAKRESETTWIVCDDDVDIGRVVICSPSDVYSATTPSGITLGAFTSLGEAKDALGEWRKGVRS
jgi:hypothetical protein